MSTIVRDPLSSRYPPGLPSHPLGLDPTSLTEDVSLGDVGRDLFHLARPRVRERGDVDVLDPPVERALTGAPVPAHPVTMSYRYSCPICGIDLTVANYDTPDADYYCPYCSTPQGPSRISIGLSEDQLEP